MQAGMSKATKQPRDVRPTIFLGVTADVSLGLMSGFPEYMAGLGWNVHVGTGPGPRSDELRATPGIYIHTIAMERDPAPVRDLRALFGWVRVLRSTCPDVVATGTPKAGLLGIMAAWFLRVPHRVYIVRGLRLETTSGALRRVLATIEKLTFALSTHAIAVSPSLRREVISLGLVGEEKVSTLGLGSSNGVDTNRFRPRDPSGLSIVKLRQSLGLTEGVPTIGFIGRLNKDKGLDMLDSAVRMLVANDVEFQLLVVGGAERINGAEPNDFGPGVRVVYTGHIADTSEYYALIDILCLPTRREGFPNVVLEAAASAVPTVTTNATGAVDSVIDGDTGFIVDKEDPQALADALARLIHDPILRTSLGERARRWTSEEFDQAIVWENTGDYFSSLIPPSAIKIKRTARRTGSES